VWVLRSISVAEQAYKRETVSNVGGDRKQEIRVHSSSHMKPLNMEH